MQSIAGTFLYISSTVNITMLVALNKIGSEQALPTNYTINKTKMLMEYAATQPDPVIRFHASDMCIHNDSDAAYLVQTIERSRAVGRYYLSDTPLPPPIRPTPTPNGLILTKCKNIRTVMASAAEAETIAIFLSVHQPVPIHTILIEMVPSATAQSNQD